MLVGGSSAIGFAIKGSAAEALRKDGAGSKDCSEPQFTSVVQVSDDAPPCSVCGAFMVRQGACYRCLNCGSQSGCG